jgi:hypothetical protein
MPKRIQRKRTKGWKMPDGAVYVGRPTMFGNPFKVKDAEAAGYKDGNKMVVWAFREWLRGAPDFADHQPELRSVIKNLLPELRGKDLACWCRPDQQCHADVLLEIANS